jgi:hypothetical protein
VIGSACIPRPAVVPVLITREQAARLHPVVDDGWQLPRVVGSGHTHWITPTRKTTTASLPNAPTRATAATIAALIGPSALGGLLDTAHKRRRHGFECRHCASSRSD